MILSNQ